MTDTNEEDVVEITDIIEEKDDEGKDTTDWKAKALEFQELAKKNHGVAQRYKTKLGKTKESSTETKPNPTQEKSDELGNGDKALLVAYGVKTVDEIALAKSWMKRTGDDIDVMINDDIFKAKLDALREAKTVQAAIPQGTKRTGNNVKDTESYHIQRYLDGAELNDLPREFRMKAIQAKTKGQSGNKMFYNS